MRSRRHRQGTEHEKQEYFLQRIRFGHKCRRVTIVILLYLKMHFPKLMPAVLSAAFLVARIDGLAPARARLPNIRHVPTPAIKWQSSYNRNRVLESSVVSSIEIPTVESQRSLNRIQSNIVKALMVTYIASMCVALPVALFPVFLLYRANIIDRVRKEKWSLKVG